MSQSVFIVSVALIEMDFTARARRKKIHFEFKEIRTFNYNIMQMIFSWSFFSVFLVFVAYKIGSVFAKWRCLIWSLAPWAKVSLSEINVQSFVRCALEFVRGILCKWSFRIAHIYLSVRYQPNGILCNRSNRKSVGWQTTNENLHPYKIYYTHMKVKPLYAISTERLRLTEKNEKKEIIIIFC